MQISVVKPEAVAGATAIHDDSFWSALCPLLMSIVTRWVYGANVATWSGQEADVAYDITYTAIRKMIEYAQHAQQKDIAIASMQRLAIVIAKNYFQDTRRKDFRLLRGEVASYFLDESLASRVEDDLEDIVLNIMIEESLFHQVAELIAQFPPKLRRAVLIDLALRIDEHGDFHCHPTALRQAFVDVGIDLEDYLLLAPDTPVLRSRHASLVSLAYKRIARSVRF